MAGIKLYLATSQIWTHYFKNKERLASSEDCIAKNFENGKSLYVTSGECGPALVLYGSKSDDSSDGDKVLLYKPIRNKEECSSAAVNLITMYLAEVVEEKPKIIDLPMKDIPDVEDVEPDEDDEEQKILDTIYEREDELEQAVGDCLAKILIEDDVVAVKENYPGVITDVLNALMQYLYDEHNISTYRPTMLEDKITGEEVFAEFPYGWDDEYEGDN